MAIRNRLQNDWNDWIRFAKVPLIDQIWKMSYSTHCTITTMFIKYLRTYMELWQEYIYKHKRFHIGRHVACDLIFIIKFSQLQRWANIVFISGHTWHGGNIPILIWITVRRSLLKDITITVKVGFQYKHGVKKRLWCNFCF